MNQGTQRWILVDDLKQLCTQYLQMSENELKERMLQVNLGAQDPHELKTKIMELIKQSKIENNQDNIQKQIDNTKIEEIQGAQNQALKHFYQNSDIIISSDQFYPNNKSLLKSKNKDLSQIQQNSSQRSDLNFHDNKDISQKEIEIIYQESYKPPLRDEQINSAQNKYIEITTDLLRINQEMLANQQTNSQKNYQQHQNNQMQVTQNFKSKNQIIEKNSKNEKYHQTNTGRIIKDKSKTDSITQSDKTNKNKQTTQGNETPAGDQQIIQLTNHFIHITSMMKNLQTCEIANSDQIPKEQTQLNGQNNKLQIEQGCQSTQMNDSDMFQTKKEQKAREQNNFITKLDKIKMIRNLQTSKSNFQQNSSKLKNLSNLSQQQTQNSNSTSQKIDEMIKMSEKINYQNQLIYQKNNDQCNLESKQSNQKDLIQQTIYHHSYKQFVDVKSDMESQQIQQSKILQQIFDPSNHQVNDQKKVIESQQINESQNNDQFIDQKQEIESQQINRSLTAQTQINKINDQFIDQKQEIESQQIHESYDIQSQMDTINNCFIDQKPDIESQQMKQSSIISQKINTSNNECIDTKLNSQIQQISLKFIFQTLNDKYAIKYINKNNELVQHLLNFTSTINVTVDRNMRYYCLYNPKSQQQNLYILHNDQNSETSNYSTILNFEIFNNLPLSINIPLIINNLKNNNKQKQIYLLWSNRNKQHITWWNIQFSQEDQILFKEHRGHSKNQFKKEFFFDTLEYHFEQCQHRQVQCISYGSHFDYQNQNLNFSNETISSLNHLKNVQFSIVGSINQNILLQIGRNPFSNCNFNESTRVKMKSKIIKNYNLNDVQQVNDVDLKKKKRMIKDDRLIPIEQKVNSTQTEQILTDSDIIKIWKDIPSNMIDTIRTVFLDKQILSSIQSASSEEFLLVSKWIKRSLRLLIFFAKIYLMIKGHRIFLMSLLLALIYYKSK